jgi:hypothetical protein
VVALAGVLTTGQAGALRRGDFGLIRRTPQPRTKHCDSEFSGAAQPRCPRLRGRSSASRMPVASLGWTRSPSRFRFRGRATHARVIEAKASGEAEPTHVGVAARQALRSARFLPDCRSDPAGRLTSTAATGLFATINVSTLVCRPSIGLLVDRIFAPRLAVGGQSARASLMESGPTPRSEGNRENYIRTSPGARGHEQTYE